MDIFDDLDTRIMSIYDRSIVMTLFSDYIKRTNKNYYVAIDSYLDDIEELIQESFKRSLADAGSNTIKVKTNTPLDMLGDSDESESEEDVHLQTMLNKVSTITKTYKKILIELERNNRKKKFSLKFW